MGIEEEHLTTGWEPDVPAHDTMLRRFLFNWTSDVETMALQIGGRVQRTSALGMADIGRPAGIANCVTLLRPVGENEWASIHEEIDEFFFADQGTGWVLFVSAWPTPDLRSADWKLMGYPPLHLRPAGGAPPDVPEGLRITQVVDLAGLRAFEQVMVTGFPLFEEMLESFIPGQLFDEQALSISNSFRWVGWLNDRAVSAASAHVAHGLVNVDLVVTLPDARRRGFGEALTWRATLAAPDLPAMLVSSDEGRPIYERMGYMPLQRLTFWYRDRPTQSCLTRR